MSEPYKDVTNEELRALFPQGGQGRIKGTLSSAPESSRDSKKYYRTLLSLPDSSDAPSLTPPVWTAEERKQRPVVTGVLDYFPDAIQEVARCSYQGNEQHNPGKPLHWDRSKSQDEADALGRHLLERGTFDSDGIRHSAKVAWRALALLQKEIEDSR